MNFDVAVIGGGAAGLSAALVLSRARRSVVVFDDGKPRNAGAAHAHGMLGHDGIAPEELLRIGRAEVKSYGGRVIEERVNAVREIADDQYLVTSAQSEVVVSVVVLATGFVDLLPPIGGLAEIWGTDAADCPYCHGWEARDSAIAVAGVADKLPRAAALLTGWSKDVMLFSAGSVTYEPQVLNRLADAGVVIVPFDVKRVALAGRRLQSLVLTNGAEIQRDAIFVSTTHASASALVDTLCEVDDAGFVKTDASGATSRAGVWAIGNVTDAYAKLVHSAAAGSRAAAKINDFLLERDLRTRRLARK